MTTPLKVIFMGSPEFAIPALDALVEAGHQVVCVYSQPARPSGRGRKLNKTPVHLRAEALGLDVRTPETLKTTANQAEFSSLRAEIAVVVAYGLILPKAILDAPRHGCINLHASLLPRWRGAAPIQRAIMAGDTLTGVQAMLMEPGLDTGPVIAEETARIFPFDTAGDLHDRLSQLGGGLIVRAVEGYVAGTIKPETQSEEGVCYAHKISASDQKVDWRRPAIEIDRQIRGLSPFPGAWCLWTPPGEATPLRLKLLLSRVEQGNGEPGEALDDNLLIACGDGALRLTRLQRPGKGPMEAEDFLRGADVSRGMRLD